MLRPLHIRGFAPGACSRVIKCTCQYTRGSIFKFAQFASWSILRGGILLPRMNYTHEIVGTHGGALLQQRASGT